MAKVIMSLKVHYALMKVCLCTYICSLFQLNLSKHQLVLQLPFQRRACRTGLRRYGPNETQSASNHALFSTAICWLGVQEYEGP